MRALLDDTEPVTPRKTYRADIDTKRPDWAPVPWPGTYDRGVMPLLTIREEAPEKVANLISSELAPPAESWMADTRKAWHSPVLDIDFPARLVPSSTEGHFHLYLDGLAIDWPTYRRLLDALAVAGVIEEGYANASIERKATYVRKPGIKKGAGLPPIGEEF